MRTIFFFCAMLCAAALNWSQPMPGQSEEAYRAREKIDSLRRHLERAAFKAEEQQAWRACVRGKGEFLAAGRKGDSAFAQVDSLLRRAKTSGMPPGDPEVAKLMERKFLLENGLEERYLASKDGRRCADLEEKRRAKLEKALQAHPEYKRWKATEGGTAPRPI